MNSWNDTEPEGFKLWQALLVALVLHALTGLLLWRVPGAFASYFYLSEEELRALAEEDRQPPLRFEFVDIPDEPEVEPEAPKALSDRSRRARGQPRPETADEADDPDPHAEGTTFQKVDVRPSAQELAAASALETRVPGPGRGEEAIPGGVNRGLQAPEEEMDPGPAEGTGTGPSGNLLASIPRISESDLLESFRNPGGYTPMEIGTVSFDTAAIDWGPYARRMLRVIRRSWIERLPPAARTGLRGVAVVNFRIAEDGSVSAITLLDSYGVRVRPAGRMQMTDGIRPFESTAMEAIEVSELPPLPDIFPGPDVGVSIGFFYNLRPPR
ncbi:MAG: hypothetical protein V3U98_06345 [Acidobacteriota bacterium]